MPASGWAAVSAGSDIRSGAVSKALCTSTSASTPSTTIAYGCQLVAGRPAALAEPLPADPGERVLQAVDQPGRDAQQRGLQAAHPRPLGERREQQGGAQHHAHDQPVPHRFGAALARRVAARPR